MGKSEWFPFSERHENKREEHNTNHDTLTLHIEDLPEGKADTGSYEEPRVKLLMNDHQNASKKVKGQLREQTDERMIHKEARIAGTCLIMQSSYLKSEAFGHSIDDRNQEEEAGETNSSRKRRAKYSL